MNEAQRPAAFDVAGDKISLVGCQVGYTQGTLVVDNWQGLGVMLTDIDPKRCLVSPNGKQVVISGNVVDRRARIQAVRGQEAFKGRVCIPVADPSELEALMQYLSRHRFRIEEDVG